MNRDLAKSTINEKMAKVHECVHALKCARDAIPIGGKELEQIDIVGIHALISVLVDSLDSAVDIACDDMADYFQSWGG